MKQLPAMPLHALRSTVLISALAALLQWSTAACAPPPPDPASLYQRAGGAAVITAVTSDFVDMASADPRTAYAWRKVNLQHTKKMLAEFLCSLTRGPCTYSGDSMKEVHAGMGITETQMYATVELLRNVMVAHDVPLRERNEILSLLAPMERQVVEQ